MASWYVAESAKERAEGRRRRQNAWITLGLALFTYLTFIGGRNLLW